MNSTNTLHVRVADGFWGRFRGLMLTSHLAPDAALLMTRCPSIHTCFMRYALDVAFLDDQGCVVKLAHAMRPWRASFGGRGAAHVLELAEGGLARFDLRLGDRIALSAHAHHAPQRAALQGEAS
jgi:uncharacterized membrane protein (UPF0127 family)